VYAKNATKSIHFVQVAIQQIVQFVNLVTSLRTTLATFVGKRDLKAAFCAILSNVLVVELGTSLKTQPASIAQQGSQIAWLVIQSTACPVQ
jgi:hypothetical protein